MITRSRGPEGGQRSMVMQGLIHEMRVMDANSDYTPVLILIKRGTDDMCALLDQEDVDGLYEFLSHYVTEKS